MYLCTQQSFHIYYPEHGENSADGSCKSHGIQDRRLYRDLLMKGRMDEIVRGIDNSLYPLSFTPHPLPQTTPLSMFSSFFIWKDVCNISFRCNILKYYRDNSLFIITFSSFSSQAPGCLIWTPFVHLSNIAPRHLLSELLSLLLIYLCVARWMILAGHVVSAWQFFLWASTHENVPFF